MLNPETQTLKEIVNSNLFGTIYIEEILMDKYQNKCFKGKEELFEFFLDNHSLESCDFDTHLILDVIHSNCYLNLRTNNIDIYIHKDMYSHGTVVSGFLKGSEFLFIDSCSNYLNLNYESNSK